MQGSPQGIRSRASSTDAVTDMHSLSLYYFVSDRELRVVDIELGDAAQQVARVNRKRRPRPSPPFVTPVVSLRLFPLASFGPVLALETESSRTRE